MPLLSSPFSFPPPPSCLSPPQPLALAPRPWAWRLLRNPRLGEARCLFSPPLSFPHPTLPRASPAPSPRSRTLGVEAAPKSTPRRSPMPASPRPSSLSLTLASRLPTALASLPDLGRGGDSESTPRRSPMPLLSSPFFPSPLASRLPGPRLAPGPWAWRLLRESTPRAKPDASSLLPFLPSSCLALPSPRLAPGPWAWRLLRNPHLGEAQCFFFSLPPPLFPRLPHRPRSLDRTLGVEATPKSTPRRSPMSLFLSLPPFSFPLSFGLPRPLASLPDLGRGGYSEIHT
jgi:hypothetical protein